jgi:hypothetical protein
MEVVHEDARRMWLLEVPLDEMDEMDDRSIFKQITMSIHSCHSRLTQPTKHETESMVNEKISMEKLVKIRYLLSQCELILSIP